MPLRPKPTEYSKLYLKKQFKTSSFLLKHDNIYDFYASCWQRNPSALPLLYVRAVIFIVCLGILLASIILIEMQMRYYFWPIYLTHWNLVLITLTSGFALSVSLKAYSKSCTEKIYSLTLPWYVKVYWALFNSTITTSFLITVVYYAFLSTLEVNDLSVDPMLDVFLHGISSVLMLASLMTSRQPANILHFYFPLVLALIYLAFNLIYYLAGGHDPMGNHYIYPNLDWQKPCQTVLLCVCAAIVIIVLHLFVVILAFLRDFFSRKYKSDSISLSSA